jgi:hypothetical protein
MELGQEKKPGGLTAALVVVGTVFVVLLLKDTLPSLTRYVIACLAGGALAAVGYFIETKFIQK